MAKRKIVEWLHNSIVLRGRAVYFLAVLMVMVMLPVHAQTNGAPTANAGQDFSVDDGDLVTLGGSATDPENNVLSYSWT